MEVAVKQLDSKEVGKVSLRDTVFGLKPRADLIQRLVVYQLAKRRAGTRRTKTRAEIARTGAKWGRQKGSGRARHGSRRAPIFRGGGRAHGPVVRSHAIDLPKKVRKLALCHVLSAKYAAGNLVVLDAATMDKPKTSQAAAWLRTLGLSSAVLLDAKPNEHFSLSVRNIPHFDVLPASGLNGYDVMRREHLVLTRDALAEIQERLG